MRPLINPFLLSLPIRFSVSLGINSHDSEEEAKLCFGGCFLTLEYGKSSYLFLLLSIYCNRYNFFLTSQKYELPSEAITREERCKDELENACGVRKCVFLVRSVNRHEW